MSARILVVDDQPLNVKLLEVKLSTEYYEVIDASDGRGRAGDGALYEAKRGGRNKIVAAARAGI